MAAEICDDRWSLTRRFSAPFAPPQSLFGAQRVNGGVAYLAIAKSEASL